MDKRDFLKGSMAVAVTMAVSSMTEARGEGGTNVPRVNWSGNYRYHTDKVLEPVTVAEVQDAVRSVTSLRALGTRHSFNGIADSTVAQISTLGLKDVHLDAAAKIARVGAGIKYGDLAVQIDKQGWALHNLASLPHISVGGACSTATHGSGLNNGNLATAVREIEFVTADGEVRILSRAKDGDKFAGAVVGLGSLGVMTHLTLAVQPKFDMTQVVYENLPFAELEHHLSDIMDAAYSVSLFTDWQNGLAKQVWLKRRVDQGGTAAPSPLFHGATLAKEKLHPVGHGTNPEACTDQGNIVGPWYERLPHFKMGFTPSSGDELQTEFFVPFDRGYEAIRAVETLRDQITPHLLVTELRAVAADDLWMSMAYKRPSLAIHFTWKPEWDAVLKIVPQIEEKLAPFATRPHWAKVFTLKEADLEPRYPRFHDFKALINEYDPKRKFLNDFMRKEVFA
jgi:xylitol oxidase